MAEGDGDVDGAVFGADTEFEAGKDKTVDRIAGDVGTRRPLGIERALAPQRIR